MTITLISTTDTTQRDVAKVTTTFVPLPSYYVDLQVGNNADGTDYAGSGVTETTPTIQVKTQSVNSNEAATYYFRAENDGNSANYIRVTGEAGSGVTVTYYNAKTGGTDITSQMTGSGYLTSLAVATSTEGRVVVTNSGNSLITSEVTITLISTNDTTQKDVAKVTTTFIPISAYSVDLQIGTLESGSDYVGSGVTETTPTIQVKTQSVNSNEAATYYFRAENDGNVANYIKVTGEAGSGVTVTYYNAKSGGTDITSQMTGSGYLTNLAVATSTEGRIIVTNSGNSLITSEVTITLISTNDTTQKDVAKATTTFVPIPSVGSFVITSSSDAIALQNIATTIVAKKPDGSLQTTILENVLLSVDSGTISPMTIESSSFVNGSWTGNIILSTVGGKTITVSNSSTSTNFYVVVYNATLEYPSSLLGIDGFSVYIPASATSSELNLSVAKLTSLPGELPFGYTLLGDAFTISANTSSISRNAIITMPISRTGKGGRVYYWNGTRWTNDNIVISAISSNLVTLESSVFASFAYIESLSTNLVRFGPNPYNPLNGSAKIWYWLESEKNTDIYIMDLTGNVVIKKSFQSGSNGALSGENTVEYDGRSAWGDILANGVYLYKIIQDNKVVGSGKISIIN